MAIAQYVAGSVALNSVPPVTLPPCINFNLTGFQILENPAVRMFLSAGPVMFILLGLSILMVAIVLVKVRQFLKCDLKRIGFVEDVFAAVKKGEPLRAAALLDQSRHPVARVLEKVLATVGVPAGRSGIDRNP